MNEIKPFTQEEYNKLLYDSILAECSLVPSRTLIFVQSLSDGRVRLMAGEQDCGDIYDDWWEFSCKEHALIALVTWDSDKQDEPALWDCHPDTGRYRISGHRELEYVRPAKAMCNDECTFEEKIEHAIKVTQDKNRVVTNIEEDSAHIGKPMPKGTQCFHVFSTSATCDHTPRCKWVDRVYCYADRFVVIGMWDLPYISLANVVQRLRGV